MVEETNEKLRQNMHEALELADKKFEIVGRLIKSVMDTMLRLHSEVTMCEDDKKGLEALMGTEEEKAEGEKEEE